jgi:hypothetical protein
MGTGLTDSRVEPARQALARALGDVQFPEVLIEIDGLTQFSWILLGRYPVNPWRSLRKANRRVEKRIYFRDRPGACGEALFRQATPR